MNGLVYNLVQLCNTHKEGSAGTRKRRKQGLSLVGNQLAEMGHAKLPLNGLKNRHVTKLVDLWSRQGLSYGTIENRLSYIRWWANKVGLGHRLHKENIYYGIPSRTLSTESKSIALSEGILRKVGGEYASRIRCSLKLQREFGLRREESILFVPRYAILRDDEGGIVKIRLKGSWTKGGRPREIKVKTEGQLAVLEEALALAGEGSMIPPEMNTMKEYLNKYEYRTAQAGLNKTHGLRHCYAQTRYFELTGWECPLNGGPTELTQGQRKVDREARLQISDELGHSREDVVSAYCGKAKVVRGPKLTELDSLSTV